MSAFFFSVFFVTVFSEITGARITKFSDNVWVALVFGLKWAFRSCDLRGHVINKNLRGHVINKNVFFSVFLESIGARNIKDMVKAVLVCCLKWASRSHDLRGHVIDKNVFLAIARK